MTNPIDGSSNTTAPVSYGSGMVGQSGRQACASETSFAEALSTAQGLKFSNHAQKRLQTRDIALNDDGIARLSQAVDKAEKRGGRESLVVMDDLAFIVNIRQRLVVTAVDAQNRGEGVFTQIDSVVFAEPNQQTEA